MSKAYSCRPSEMVYPNLKDPLLQFCIDEYVFDKGFKFEMENEAELEKQRTEYYTELILAMLKAR